MLILRVSVMFLPFSFGNSLVIRQSVYQILIELLTDNAMVVNFIGMDQLDLLAMVAPGQDLVFVSWSL